MSLVKVEINDGFVYYVSSLKDLDMLQGTGQFIRTTDPANLFVLGTMHDGVVYLVGDEEDEE